MISKYNGVCSICGKPTKAGSDQYDLDSRESYHANCKQDQEDNSKPSPDQIALAERWGYRPHDELQSELLGKARLLPPMPHADRGEESGQGGAAHPRSHAALSK